MEILIKEVLTKRSLRNSQRLSLLIATVFNVGHPWG